MAEKRYESDMTKKEKRQREWKNLKNMTWGERADYIWTYYKGHMAAALLIIIACILAGQAFYHSRFEPVWYVSILNCALGDPQGMSDEFKEYLHDEEKFHEVVVDTSMYFVGNDSTEDFASDVKINTLMASGDMDSMIATEDKYQQYLNEGLLLSMDELLTQEQKDDYGEDVLPFALKVNDSEKLKEFDLCSGEDAYLVVFSYTPHIEQAKEFIKYIYEGE